MSLTEIDENRVESLIQEIGGACFEEIRGQRLSIMDPRAYTGKLMNWATSDPDFRVALFRFVDVLPSLETPDAVIRHAQAYFGSVAHRLPGLFQWGLGVDPYSLKARAAAMLIRRHISAFGKQFIIGSSPRDALPKLKKIHAGGMTTTVDLLGEACVSNKESEIYLNRYLQLLEELEGEIPVNISVKLSALYARSKPVGFEDSVSVLKKQLRIILKKAREAGAFVYVDMEDTSKTDITLEVFKSLLMEKEFRAWKDAGFVLQAYLRRTADDLEGLLQWVKERDCPVSIRLVKGAYWDTETILAKLANWPLPVWQEKAASDHSYEVLSRYLLENHEILRPAFASHNLRSLVHAMVVAEELGLGRSDYEFQTLYGMADPVKKVFVERGLRIREYVPIGDMLTGMAYLVRRLLENTANEGFIRSGFLERESAQVLLRKPMVESPDHGAQHLEEDSRETFRNCPLSDFSIEENRTRVRAELDNFLFPQNGDYPRIFPVIDGKQVKDCREFLPSESPENLSLRLGVVGMAEPMHLDQAMDSLQRGFKSWRATPVEKRAEVLFKAADRMEKQRSRLTALIILECGKPWLEADADVAEAIDFCRYYAHEALGMFRQRSLCSHDGEEDLYFYEPRGVCAVIGPWNFPMAIPCGMMAAAIVTGNTVALKPAEQSPVVARRLFEIFFESGLPENAAAFLPGLGEGIGAALVSSPVVQTIVFTGSREIGFEIIHRGSEMRSGQIHVKRVVAEMGGKNAIVVDDGADLDQAVKGILYSAYGYAGQKCSACSRLYIHRDAYDRLMERLVEAVRTLACGRASDPSVDLGPVIDEEAEKRITKAVESTNFERISGGMADGLPTGRYIPATLFPEVPFDHSLMVNELFGPVLACAKVSSFQEGLDRANESEYGLTGGVYSRQPEHLRLAARSFRVGNLYLNRPCTGALVGRQPFGGFKHSGVGSKAGGPDYLKQFVIPRLVSENTLRQGFAPMEEDL